MGFLRSYSQQLANVLRGEPDPEAPAIGTWSLADVAKHLASGTENYARWIQGRDAPDLWDIRNMPTWNIETVRNLPAAELPDLAERIESATQELLETAQEKASRERVCWYARSNIPVEIAVALRLGEVAVHGLDIAHAARARWEIDPDAAREISYGLAFIGPRFVDPRKLHFDGTSRIRIRGGSDLYYIVQDRTLDVAATGSRPGWTLSLTRPRGCSYQQAAGINGPRHCGARSSAGEKARCCRSSSKPRASRVSGKPGGCQHASPSARISMTSR